MPTLTRIIPANPPPKKSPPTGNIHRNDGNDDERFSQVPEDGGATGTILVARSRNRRRRHDAIARASSPSPSLSIARAIESHCRGGDEDGGGGHATSDVVAVILSAATSGATGVPGDGVVRLLVSDASMPRGRCARVVANDVPAGLVLPSRSGAFASAGLRPGDVVRWNRLEVRRVYVDDDRDDDRRDETLDSSNTSPGWKRSRSRDGVARREDDVPKGDDYDDDDDENADNDDIGQHHRPSLSVACDLSMSWRDPEAGPTAVRLCRIVPFESSSFAAAATDDALETIGNRPCPRQPSTMAKHDRNGRREWRRDFDRFDLEWEGNVPPSMETPTDVVVDLARWYCANARPHFSKATATSPANRPCRRRNLRDITAPNLLSHVVVKVLRCERPNLASHGMAKSNLAVTHVTMSDGVESDDLMGMVSASSLGGRRLMPSPMPSIPSSISSVLLRSMEDGSRVLLTHALSRASTCGKGGGVSSQDRGSLVLVPTAETTASILASDHPYYTHETNAQRDGEGRSALQLVSVISQQHWHCRGVMAVEAPLMDIIVDGVCTSFIEGAHWQCPRILSRFLIDRPSIHNKFQAIELTPSYRSATLLLDLMSVGSDIVVNASGDAMKLICLDVPVEDMAMDATTVTPNPYLSHVGDLLKALCTQKVPIRWTLEQESECAWFVTNATLLHI